MLHFFLPRFVLVDILILQLIFEHDDEILDIFSIEVPLFFFSLLCVHILRHFEHIELFLDYFVHYHISHLVFLAYAVSLAELFEQSLQAVEVCIESGSFSIAENDNVVTSVEEFYEVIGALLENEVDHVEHFYFLALVVPDLVGHLKLQEHIFEDELDV